MSFLRKISAEVSINALYNKTDLLLTMFNFLILNETFYFSNGKTIYCVVVNLE